MEQWGNLCTGYSEHALEPTYTSIVTCSPWLCMFLGFVGGLDGADGGRGSCCGHGVNGGGGVDGKGWRVGGVDGGGGGDGYGMVVGVCWHSLYFLFLHFDALFMTDTVTVRQEDMGGHAANDRGLESNPGRCHKDCALMEVLYPVGVSPELSPRHSLYMNRYCKRKSCETEQVCFVGK